MLAVAFLSPRAAYKNIAHNLSRFKFTSKKRSAIRDAILKVIASGKDCDFMAVYKAMPSATSIVDVISLVYDIDYCSLPQFIQRHYLGMNAGPYKIVKH